MQRLIFDIGMNHGQDTGYYLWLNHRVVAIDADPTLIDLARQTFAAQVASGQFKPVNCAISYEEGSTIDFFISEKDEWNSLKKEIAERKTSVKGVVKVGVRRLASLMDEFGVPYYCKIDIEGYDEVALDTLKGAAQVPTFISAESECAGDQTLSEEQALSTLRKMHELGYQKFKLVDQATLSVLESNVKFYDNAHLAQKGLDKVLRKVNAGWGYGARQEAVKRAGYLFPETSSGFFGEDLAGDWVDYATATELLLRHRRDYFRLPTAVSYGFWCDWHATV